MTTPLFRPALETADREALQARQLDRFQVQLNELWASNRFYKGKLVSAGLGAPAEVRTFGDYRQLPFTTKTEIARDQADHPPFGSNLTYPLERYVKLHQTSGTSGGRPIRWLDTAESSPTYALRLAEVAREQGIDLASSAVRVTIHAGEPGASIPATRRKIDESWGATSHDHTGLTEVGATGFTCSERAGVHLIESEFIFEVIDPATGLPVGPGERGELVVSNLGRTCMPLLRYRTGDLVELDESRCACGRTFARMKGGVLGRADDMVIVRGVNVFPSSIEDIVREFPQVEEFRLELHTGGTLADLRLLLELRGDCVDPPAELAELVAVAIQRRLLLRVECRCVEPGSLPRFELKARRFFRLEQ